MRVISALLRTLLIFTVLQIVSATGVHADKLPPNKLPLMRISSENTATHIQAVTLQRFADLLAQRLEGQIDVQFYDRARLYRGRDVIEALQKGKVEMAVPGTWHISQFEPNVGILLLPAFYGRDAQEIHTLIDGPFGKSLASRIERRSGAVVIGRWLDLGPVHIFTVSKKLQTYADISNLRIRVAGGRGNELRIQALGGIPTSIPWPDLTEHLKHGTVDAVLTTHETVRSADLLTHGIRYAFEDNQYFAQYIPLISRTFWNRLPAETQHIIATTWDDLVNRQRREAHASQQRARKALHQRGLRIITPDSASLHAWRQRILHAQNDIAHELGIDDTLLQQALTALQTQEAGHVQSR